MHSKKCRPVGRQEPVLSITRRQFLGGIASTPLLLPSILSAAAGDVFQREIELDISPDGSLLTASEYRSPSRENATSDANAPITRTLCASWKLPAASLGPHAWFELHRPEKEGTTSSFTIEVRNVQLGRFVPDRIAFELTQNNESEPWRLCLHARMHRGGPSFHSTKVEFAVFSKEDVAFLPVAVPLDAAKQFVTEMLAERVAVLHSAAPTCSLTMDRNVVFSLISPAGTPPFSFFGGSIVATSLNFAWKDSVDDCNPFFVASAAGRVATSANAIVVGDASSQHLLVSPAAKESLSTELRWGPLPTDGVEGFVASVALGAVSVSVAKKRDCILGPLNIDDFVITETELGRKTKSPAKREYVLRTTAWGKAPPVASEDPAGIRKGSQEITSPIGWLRVAAPSFEGNENSAAQDNETVAKEGPSVVCATDPAKPGTEKSTFLAAAGDRRGAPEATFYSVHDRGSSAAAFRRIAIDVGLLEAAVAVPDTTYSRLHFDRADLRFNYEDGIAFEELPDGEYPNAPASSFIWIGDTQGRPEPLRARIDLSRARLVCARDIDLVKLTFRFVDLALEFRGGERPRVFAATEECRVLASDVKGGAHDSRPVLIVEFDPQHIMEETIFRPTPPPLPDVVSNPAEGASPNAPGTPSIATPAESELTQSAILKRLATLDTVESRKDYRIEVQHKKNEANNEVFATFAKEYADKAAALDLPADQKVYVGPFALDPDAMALARKVQSESKNATIQETLNRMFDSARIAFARLRSADVITKPDAADTGDVQFQQALRGETLVEQQLPLYGLFRDYWRERIVDARSAAGFGDARDALGIDANTSGRIDEYLLDENRKVHPLAQEDAPINLRDKLESTFREEFAALATGAEKIPELMEARLSGKTRLAFRINCAAPFGTTAAEAGVAHGSGDSDLRPGPGVVHYSAFDFTFDALTDWSRHEPAVTRRACKFFAPLASGVLPPLGHRAANLNDHSILRFQNIAAGPRTTSQERMGEIRDSLRVMPSDTETSIEIPARLILSTAQDAIWQTQRQLPLAALTQSGCDPTTTTGARVRDEKAKEAPSLVAPVPLWTARLDTIDVSPSVRVVGSPDFRLTALGVFPSPGAQLLPGQAPPPRGPWAPWLLGPEQMDGKTLTCGDVAKDIANPDTCSASKPNKPRHPLLDWLLGRSSARARRLRLNANCDLRKFRTSLDANDRHQLVLLSSAYGLPVIGKRQAKDGDGDTPGSLVEDAGQFEPGQDFTLIDGGNGQAIFRPVPLIVKELSLSALGGSFAHDTVFKPPASAVDAYGRKAFDSMSIERWQHDAVDGRDMHVTVVYKGYLLPFGHRASLVKETLRVPLRTDTCNREIKAMLRQRLFIQVASPRKLYPAIGQPYAGRLWCAKTVRLLTTRTPDLLDPANALNSYPDKGQENANGRIGLGSRPGLVFWPRTDITAEGLLNFDVSIDGAICRLPMMFVENTAATDSEALRTAVEHYNGTLGELTDELRSQASVRRSVAFGGQKLTFADAKQPNETSYATEKLLVKVHGRLRETTPDWVGNLDGFQITSVLEGAEQPPFYPSVECATLRLTRAERLTGSAELCVDAQYDGYYVNNGFEPSIETAPPGCPGQDPGPIANPEEVFMNFRDSVKLDMGPNGDHSAAIARPHTYMIALGRISGLLGARDGIDVTWLTGPVRCLAVADQVADKDSKAKELTYVRKYSKGLVSLADWFGGHRKPSEDENKLVPAVQVAKTAKQPDTSQRGNLEKLKSFFSSDAKLLGTITLSQLMQLLELSGIKLPMLNEVIDYGTALQHAGEGAANDVRSRVLAPAHEVVGRLLRSWDELGTKISKQQAQLPGGEPIRLAKFYPEIDQTLRDLDRQIGEALVHTGLAALAADTSAIYQSAQTLLNALSVLLTHPAEHLEEAIGANLRTQISALLKKVDAIEGGLGTIDLSAWIDPGTEVTDGLSPDTADTALFLAFELRDITPSLRANLSPAAVTAASSMLQDVQSALEKIWHASKEKATGRLATLLQQITLSVLKGDVEIGKIDVWLSGILGDVFGDLLKDVSEGVSDVLGHIDANADAASKIVKSRLNRYKASINALQYSLTNREYIPDLAVPISLARRFALAFAHIRDLAKAFDTRNPKDLRTHAAALMQDLFSDNVLSAKGADVQGATFSGAFQASVLEYVNERFKPVAKAFACDGANPPAGFAQDLEVYTPIDDGNPQQLTAPQAPSTNVLNAIGRLLDALSNADDALKVFETSSDFQKLDDKGSACETDLHRLIADPATSNDLTQNTRRLYWLVVELMTDVRAIAASTTEGVVGKRLLDSFSEQTRMLRRDVGEICTTLGRMIDLVTSFTGKFGSPAQQTLLAKVAEHWIGQQAAAPIGKIEVELSSALFEVVAAMAKWLSGASDRIQAFVLKVRQQLSTLVDGAGSRFGLTLDPEARNLTDALDKLAACARDVAFETPAKPPSFGQLLDMTVIAPAITVRTLLKLDSATTALGDFGVYLQTAEHEVVVATHALLGRLQGFPQEIRRKFAQRVLKSSALKALSDNYAQLATTRDSLLALGESLPAISAAARNALRVAEPCPYTEPLCKPGADDNDELNAEKNLLAAAIAANDAESVKYERDLVLFFHSWAKGTAAPLLIVGQVSRLLQRLLSGDILAVIDINAFREQVQDAIANLIPTRVTLGYDFRSTVTQEAASNSIFQPVVGSQFVISMKTVVDLLDPVRSDYRVHGELGPFEIMLVGDLIKALRLKFRGAAFTVAAGTKARFDVLYDTFEIGPALNFAKALQPFLSPADGNGVFIQPLTRTAGLEVGYGINLQTIGIGETSFFNVILSVSAELPFDNSEALFKVSLGRLKAPFSVSVLPFAGSGYFSVFAAADGIRGFEASFEFGAGGSLSFGPLTAICRVQVGVYVRVLKVAGQQTTTIGGTFFAGGTATIWIFHFSTSLYVRLCKESDGAMYGEATYTFSFSIGIAQYDYSVTALHREGRIGSSSRGNSTAMLGKPAARFDPETALAMSDAHRVHSDDCHCNVDLLVGNHPLWEAFV